MANLTLTIKESITLNGKERGSEMVKTVETISEVYHRIAAHTTGHKALASGLKYLRVTNIGSNDVVLEITDSSSEEYAVLIQPDDSYILNNSKMDANASGGSTVGAETDMTDIDKIAATGSGGASDVEVFAAIT